MPARRSDSNERGAEARDQAPLQRCRAALGRPASVRSPLLAHPDVRDSGEEEGSVADVFDPTGLERREAGAALEKDVVVGGADAEDAAHSMALRGRAAGRS